MGNTTPRATQEIIESVLVKCAKGLETDTLFSIVEVRQLATHIENPRTRCWKVIVPYRFKQLMEKDELYPPGWTHRKFFGARASKDNPAKHSRQDDLIVNEVMREEENKLAEETRFMEERRLRQEAARLDAERKQMEEDRIQEDERVAEQEVAGELEVAMATSDSQA